MEINYAELRKLENEQYMEELEEMAYIELKEFENKQYMEELEEIDAKYGSDWDNNVGECPNWFFGICKHEFYGEKPCKDCVKHNNE